MHFEVISRQAEVSSFRTTKTIWIALTLNAFFIVLGCMEYLDRKSDESLAAHAAIWDVD